MLKIVMQVTQASSILSGFNKSPHFQDLKKNIVKKMEPTKEKGFSAQYFHIRENPFSNTHIYTKKFTTDSF